jgi:hypothetical protein
MDYKPTQNVILKNEKSFQSFTENGRKYSFSLRFRKNGELYLVISEKKVGKNVKRVTHKMRIYKEAAVKFGEKINTLLLDIIETEPDDKGEEKNEPNQATIIG